MTSRYNVEHLKYLEIEHFKWCILLAQCPPCPSPCPACGYWKEQETASFTNSAASTWDCLRFRICLLGFWWGFCFYLSYLDKKPPLLQFTCDTSRHVMFPIASSPVSVIAPETAHIGELTASNKCFIAQKYSWRNSHALYQEVSISQNSVALAQSRLQGKTKLRYAKMRTIVVMSKTCRWKVIREQSHELQCSACFECHAHAARRENFGTGPQEPEPCPDEPRWAARVTKCDKGLRRNMKQTETNLKWLKVIESFRIRQPHPAHPSRLTKGRGVGVEQSAMHDNMTMQALPRVSSCLFQLIDLTSSKKLVAAVAEKPRWESTLEQSIRNWRKKITEASSTNLALWSTAQHS